jgi:hypothetical protein
MLLAFSGFGASWTNFFPGCAPGGEPGPFMAQDRDGAVLICGNLLRADGSLDIATLKYASNGLAEWTNICQSPGYSYIGPQGMVVDSSGTVYVTGGSAGPNNMLNFVTLAYSRGGQPLWTNYYSNGQGDEYASATAVAPDGSVYVTGYEDGAYLTLGYSSNGITQWTNSYTGYNGNNIVKGIGVGSHGSVFVTGGSTSNGDFQFATVAYRSNGIPLWTNRYTGAPDSTETVTAMAIDQSDNVYVVGDYAAVAYTAGGTPLWTNAFDELAAAIAVDRWSNCCVAGSISGDLGWSEIQTVKYAPNGQPLWTNLAGGLPFGSSPNAITTDPYGDVYVTGENITTNEGGDYLTIAYSPDGVPLWTNRFNGAGSQNDIPTAILLNGIGDVLVTGTSWDGQSNDLGTIEIVPPSVLVAGDRGFGFNDGAFSFDLYGEIGSSISIQTSANLTEWTTISTNVLPTSLVHFQAPRTVESTAGFYRGIVVR